MARKVERWEANDGSLHVSEYECKKHEADGKFECPKCKGVGRVNGEPITEARYDAEATAWGGQFASPVYRDVVTGYKQVACEVCHGNGWTAEEKKPVIESKVIGWK
jgi:DnaJ-class molecular chaperone